MHRSPKAATPALDYVFSKLFPRTPSNQVLGWAKARWVLRRFNKVSVRTIDSDRLLACLADIRDRVEFPNSTTGQVFRHKANELIQSLPNEEECPAPPANAPSAREFGLADNP